MRKCKCDICGKMYTPKEIILPKKMTKKVFITIWNSLNCNDCNKQTKMLHKLMKTASKEDIKKKNKFVDKMVEMVQ
jgi:hypothetical protein